jgi:NTE family protein
MKRPVACLAALWTAAALAACSYPIRNDAIGPGSRPQYEWGLLAPGDLQDTLVVVSASGGGTRATALTMSVLRAMDKIKLASGASLADEIDILSSVSGGSVTAGYFALYGAAGLPTLEKNFVRQDGMRAIIAEGLNPVGLALLATPSKERIDLFVDYLDRQLFHDVTFEKLVERKRRPYLILNAADMVEGTPFPFTQYTMDLLCSDLTKMKLSTAVAASAAFPVALSPITLKNYRTAKNEPPCPVRKPGWLKPAEGTSWYLDPPRVGMAADRLGLRRRAEEIHPSARWRHCRQSRRQRILPPVDQRRCRSAIQAEYPLRQDQEDRLRHDQCALICALRS